MPKLAPPPDTVEMAVLLAQRYPLRKKDNLEITADPRGPSLTLQLKSGRDLYAIDLLYLRDPEGRDTWTLLIDALDALFGTFVTNGHSYRDLPTGDDVEFDGAFFRVHVEHTIPDLIAAADKLLLDD